MLHAFISFNIYHRIYNLFSEFGIKVKMSSNSESSFMTYYRLLNIPGPQNYFILPWAQIVLRNYYRGKLISYKSLIEYKKKKRPKWVICQLTVFRDNQTGDMFPVFSCSTCKTMHGIENLRIKQDRANIERMKCEHSKMCDKIIREEFIYISDPK